MCLHVLAFNHKPRFLELFECMCHHHSKFDIFFKLHIIFRQYFIYKVASVYYSHATCNAFDQILYHKFIGGSSFYFVIQFEMLNAHSECLKTQLLFPYYIGLTLNKYKNNFFLKFYSRLFSSKKCRCT